MASFWEKESFLAPCDLIVVGAGIVGLSAALFYKRDHPDSRVIVLDKGAMPEGASTRNAGFACIGSISEHVADMQKESPENIGRRIVRRYRGLQLLRETLGDEAIGYEACGGCDFFTDREAFEHSLEHVEEFNAWLKELTGENQVYSEDTLNGYPVIRNRLEGALRPGRMMQHLVRRAAAEGIEIRWNSPVASVGEGEAVLEDGQCWSSSRVLVACNGFSRRLLPEVSVAPARGYVMVTDPQPDLPWRGIFHHDRGYVYFRSVDDRLLIGGARNIAMEEEETDRFGINKKIRSHLVSFVNEHLLPGQDWSVEYEWSGIMGFTPTKTPEIRQVRPGVHVAAGLSGMGIAIGMEIARQAAGELD
ncbi:MAG: FAD-dependent oxidoreductase [Balneolaceae bacterium]|nr:FAD-dependent oxidoreductase [Balneolaceae bacterium]